MTDWRSAPRITAPSTRTSFATTPTTESASSCPSDLPLDKASETCCSRLMESGWNCRQMRTCGLRADAKNDRLVQLRAIDGLAKDGAHQSAVRSLDDRVGHQSLRRAGDGDDRRRIGSLDAKLI